MSYIQSYHHIVFATKNRVPALDSDHRRQLFKYLWGVLKNKDCHVYRMNGVEDHVHILTSIHQTLSVADLVRDLKTASSNWIRQEGLFSGFIGWQDGYGAFTKSHHDRDAVIEYIKDQVEHHRKVSFMEEFKALLQTEGIPFDERFLQ